MTFIPFLKPSQHDDIEEKQMPIELNSMIVRTGNPISSTLDDEIGRHIWGILAEPCRMDDLCNRLSLAYGAHPEQIAADLSPFLEGLRDEGLIMLVE